MTAPPASSRPERIAAIDVGSNSVRLAVAEYDPDHGLSIVDELKAQPRLGAGLAATGRLDDAAVARALEVLARMREVCRRHGVRRIAAVATAAVREAANGTEFVERVRAELGLPLRIIDPETEGALAYRAVARRLPLGGRRALVADVGGGSLELVGAADGRVELTASLPLGAVRLTELHLRAQRAAGEELSGLRAAIGERLAAALPAGAWSGTLVVGCGGTFTNLGRMALARAGRDLGPVQGTKVPRAEVEAILAWLVAIGPERRREVPGLAPERADIIVAGLAVAAELLALVDVPAVTVSASGVREGLLLELADAATGAAPLA